MSIRRTDDGDATRTPLFLVQVRYLVPTWALLEHHDVGWAQDDEGSKMIDLFDCDNAVEDEYGDPAYACFDCGKVHRALTDDELVDLGVADWEWRTVGIYLTRQEADDYCARRHYDGPFRSYSVPCEGALEELLKSITDPKGHP